MIIFEGVVAYDGSTKHCKIVQTTTHSILVHIEGNDGSLRKEILMDDFECRLILP